MDSNGSDSSTGALGQESEWVDMGMSGDYYIRRHAPCGSIVETLGGYMRLCPKCDREAWEKRVAREMKG